MRLHDLFNEKQLCKMWPSNDSEDIPFTKFTCKICGYEMQLQSCGSFFIGGPSFDELIDMKLREHLLENHCDDEFILKCSNIDLLKANVGFNRVLINNLNEKVES